MVTVGRSCMQGANPCLTTAVASYSNEIKGGAIGIMFDELSCTNLLDDWALDWSIFSLQHRTWRNQHELWRKFIRQ